MTQQGLLEADVKVTQTTVGGDKVQSDLQKSAEAAAKTQANFDKVSAAFDKTMERIKRTAAAFAAVTLGREALGGLSSIVEEGIRYNAMMEDSKVAIGTLLSSAYNYVEASSGKALSGVGKMNAAMEHAGDIQEKLRKKNLETAATYEQLSEVFQQALPYAINAGMKVGEDELVEFSATIAKIAKIAMVPMDQLGEEVRSVLAGTMRDRNTRLSPIIVSALGAADPSDANIKLKEMSQSGQMYQKLMVSLKPYIDSVAISQNNLTTIFSNFKDVMSMVLGESMLNSFHSLKRVLVDITNYIAPINKETGKMSVNRDVVQVFSKIGDTLATILTGTMAFVKFVSTVYSALGPLGTLISLLAKVGTVMLVLAGFNKIFDLMGLGIAKLGNVIKNNLVDKWAGGLAALSSNSILSTVAASGKKVSDSFFSSFTFDGSKKLYQNPFSKIVKDSFEGMSSWEKRFNVPSTTLSTWDQLKMKIAEISNISSSWGTNIATKISSGWATVSGYIQKSWEGSFKLAQSSSSAATNTSKYSTASNILAYPLKFAMFESVRSDALDAINSKIVAATNFTINWGNVGKSVGSFFSNSWANMSSILSNLTNNMRLFVAGSAQAAATKWTDFKSSMATIGANLKNMIPSWDSALSGMKGLGKQIGGLIPLAGNAAIAGLNMYMAFKMIGSMENPFKDTGETFMQSFILFGNSLYQINSGIVNFLDTLNLVPSAIKEVSDARKKLADQSTQEIQKDLEYGKIQKDKMNEQRDAVLDFHRELKDSTAKSYFTSHELDEIQKVTKDLQAATLKMREEAFKENFSANVANLEAIGNTVDAALAQNAENTRKALGSTWRAYEDTVTYMQSQLYDLEIQLSKEVIGTDAYAAALARVSEQQQKLAKFTKDYDDMVKAIKANEAAQNAKVIHQEEIKRREDLYKQYQSYFQLIGEGTSVVAAEQAAEEYSTKVKIEGLSKSVKGYKEYVAAIKAASAEKVRQMPIEYEYKQDSTLYASRINLARSFYSERLAVELEYENKMKEIQYKLDTHKYETKGGKLTARGQEVYDSDVAAADKKRLDDLRVYNYGIQNEMASNDIAIATATNEKMLAIQLEYFQKLETIKNDYEGGKYGTPGTDEAIKGFNKAVFAARATADKSGADYLASFHTSMADYQSKFADQSGSRSDMLKAQKASLEAQRETALNAASLTEQERLRIKEYYAEEIKRVDDNINDNTYSGIEDGLRRITAEQKTWYESMSNLTYNVANGLGGAFGSLFDTVSTKGKNAFQELGNIATSTLKNILSAFNKALGNQIASQIFSSIGVSDWFKSKSALGNVFSGGNVQAFALGGAFGTVLTQPTVFPMANGGTGLAGEAGPEAVIPLSRGRNGRMGVDASGLGGGGLSNLSIRVEIKNKTNQSLSASQEGQPRMDMGEIVIPIVIDAYLNNKHGLQTVINQGKKT